MQSYKIEGIKYHIICNVKDNGQQVMLVKFWRFNSWCYKAVTQTEFDIWNKGGSVNNIVNSNL